MEGHGVSIFASVNGKIYCVFKAKVKSKDEKFDTLSCSQAPLRRAVPFNLIHLFKGIVWVVAVVNLW